MVVIYGPARGWVTRSQSSGVIYYSANDCVTNQTRASDLIVGFSCAFHPLHRLGKTLTTSYPPIPHRTTSPLIRISPSPEFTKLLHTLRSSQQSLSRVDRHGGGDGGGVGFPPRNCELISKKSLNRLIAWITRTRVQRFIQHLDEERMSQNILQQLLIVIIIYQLLYAVS